MKKAPDETRVHVVRSPCAAHLTAKYQREEYNKGAVVHSSERAGKVGEESETPPCLCAME